jgi:histone-lysine N-methyltransferase SETMAR
MRKLRHVIQNKRREACFLADLYLLHDNARPHTGALTQALIISFGWEQFDHRPYSSDLARSDFHLFLRQKFVLASVSSTMTMSKKQ